MISVVGVVAVVCSFHFQAAIINALAKLFFYKLYILLFYIKKNYYHYLNHYYRDLDKIFVKRKLVYFYAI